MNSTVAVWAAAPSLSQALADTTLSIHGVRRPSLDQDFISAAPATEDKVLHLGVIVQSWEGPTLAHRQVRK